MKYQIVFMLTSLIVAILACDLPEIPSLSEVTITGSGNVVTQEQPFTDFDKVDISSAFNAKINQADSYKVIIRLDDNLVEHLQVEKAGSTLKIGLKPGISLVSNATLEAEISMPELTRIELSGSSDARISDFKSSKNLDVDLSGSSSLQGEIEAADTTFDVSGSSGVILNGTGWNLTLEASGSSDVDLSEYTVAHANLDVSGASSVIIYLRGNLVVEASGASNVIYLGRPTDIRINTSGASKVEGK
jgi:hypothetical protein